MLKVTVKGPKRVDLKLPIECPNCRQKSEIEMRNAAPGTTIRCACGAMINSPATMAERYRRQWTS
jgi:hypothetical protein